MSRHSRDKELRVLMNAMFRHPLNIEMRHARKHMGALRIRRNHPTWCGPTAVAFLTGCTINDAAQLFTNVRNRKVGTSKKYRWMRKSSTSLSGVYPGETRDVLSLLGYNMAPIANSSGVTVATLVNWRFARAGAYGRDDKLLVMIPKHYVVAHKFLVSDNHMQHVPASEHPHGGENIDKAWRVYEKPYGGHFRLAA